jgi:hypothetical protein
MVRKKYGFCWRPVEHALVVVDAPELNQPGLYKNTVSGIAQCNLFFCTSMTTRKLTPAGRAILLTGLIIVLSVLWLHYPFDGYETTCIKRATRLASRVDQNVFFAKTSPVLQCVGENDMPFTQWASLGSLNPHFVGISQLLAWEAFVVLIFRAALAFFRPEAINSMTRFLSSPPEAHLHSSFFRRVLLWELGATSRKH